VIDLVRLTLLPRIRVWLWTETRSSAVNIVFETLIGSVVNRFITSPTESAWNVVSVVCPVDMTWNSVRPSSPRISPMTMYSGRCRRAASSRSNSSTSPLSSSPKEGRVTLAIQFRWGNSTSRVSSIETIFALLGMKSETAFSEVVFPEAVPPAKMSDFWFSMLSHRNAICSSEKVFQLIRSIGVCGTSLNCRMV